jgi:hypothetical protein
MKKDSNKTISYAKKLYRDEEEVARYFSTDTLFRLKSQKNIKSNIVITNEIHEKSKLNSKKNQKTKKICTHSTKFLPITSKSRENFFEYSKGIVLKPRPHNRIFLSNKLRKNNLLENGEKMLLKNDYSIKGFIIC